MDIKDKISSLKEVIVQLLAKKNISVVLFSVLIVGIFATETFRALSSISIVAIVLFSFLCIDSQSLQKLKANKAILLLTFVFFLHLFGFFNTDFAHDTSYLSGRIMIKFPFLLLPFSILILPKLSKEKYYFLLLVFVLCSFYVSFQAIIYYFNHKEEVNLLYLQSKTVPLPLNHVRFSLMLSVSIFLAGYLCYKKVWFIHPVEVKIVGLIALFLFVFLHYLSVRSGLLAFYVLAILLAFSYAYTTKKYRVMVLVLSLSLALPIGSYFAIDTFKNKVKNTMEDLNNSDQEYIANFHSMTARFFSYRVAYKLIKKNPYFGVGIGNLDREVQKMYISSYPSIRSSSRLMPHNQFVDFTVAFGFIGLFVFILAFYGILFFKKYRGNIVILVQFLVITISFLFESTLETQLGANFSLVLIIIPLYYLISNESREDKVA